MAELGVEEMPVSLVPEPRRLLAHVAWLKDHFQRRAGPITFLSFLHSRTLPRARPLSHHQVLCVFLWLFDEYWEFSLLTLVMLVAFEAAVVAQVCVNGTPYRISLLMINLFWHS